ncbi:MAG: hypothetical protein RR034_03610 [Bacteroidales bacterium]
MAQKNTPRQTIIKESASEIWNKILNNKFVSLILFLVIALTFLSNYSAMYDKKINSNGDNIYYYSLGQALEQGIGFKDIIFIGTPNPHNHFPPGYPLFIAGIMKILPNNIDAIKTANGILLLLSIFLFFFIIKRTTGNVMVAFLTALLCCLHPTLLEWGSIMMSEMLFLFLSLSIIFLALDLRKKPLFSKEGIFNNLLLLLLLCLISYVYFVRTMGLTIILAVILWSGIIALEALWQWWKNRKNEDIKLTKGNKRYFIQCILVGLLLCLSFGITKLSWDQRNKNVGKLQSDYVNDFKMKPDGEVMTTFEDWSSRIKNNFGLYLTKWIPNSIYFTSFEKNAPITAGQWIRGVLIVLIMLWGVFKMKEGGLLFFLYTTITMGVLLIWPEQYGGGRYYVALLPLFIFFTLNGISEMVALLFSLLLKKSNPIIFQSIAVIIFSVALLFPAYVEAQKEPRKMAALSSWKKLGNPNLTNYIEACEWCGKNLPDTTRVICRKPEIFYMYSKYHKAAGFPKYAEPEEILQLLIDNKATHVIIDNWFRHAYTTLYPAILKYPEKFRMVQQFGQVDTVYKINPTFIFEFNNAWGYFGERVNGKKEGKGYQLLPDGKKFVGEFSNDQISGYGELYDSTGTLLIKGQWKDGMFVK